MLDRSHAQTTGIVMMSVAMLAIPLVDGGAKALSADHSPLFVSFARYAAACVFVLPIALARYGRSFLPREQLGAHLARTIFLVASQTTYFLAIKHVSLAAANSAYFVGPVIAMVLAVIFLGESLTARKIVSLALAFGGALIVLQPTGGIDPSLLLALASGGFFALYMIATRKASRESDPVKTLAFQCLVGAALLAPQGIFTWSTPTADDLWLLAAMGAISASSHILSITAFRQAPASTLAPLVYLELLGSVAVGYLAFSEVPSVSVWIGAPAIILGGLILLQRSGAEKVAST